MRHHDLMGLGFWSVKKDALKPHPIDPIDHLMNDAIFFWQALLFLLIGHYRCLSYHYISRTIAQSRIPGQASLVREHELFL